MHRSTIRWPITTAALATLCIAIAAVAAVPTDRDWVTILDAKSFQDWKVAPAAASSKVYNGKTIKRIRTEKSGSSGSWTFKDGILHGEGDVSHIFSPRSDYQNFMFKADIKISDKGNSGQYVRATFGNGFPNGYEAQINSTHADPQRTGSLYNLSPVTDALVPPNTWFTQEVMADGNHIVIKVNGTVVVDYTDSKNTYIKGHFAFQQHNVGSEVWIKNVMVKELPFK